MLESHELIFPQFASEYVADVNSDNLCCEQGWRVRDVLRSELRENCFVHFKRGNKQDIVDAFIQL
jgi:hypothetical protein